MRKILVEKLANRFIKMWQEIENLRKELSSFLEQHRDVPELIARHEALKISFWFDLRKKYNLLNYKRVGLNPETWQVFIEIDKNTTTQAVAKISGDLIARHKEIIQLYEEIEMTTKKGVQIIKASEAKKVLFWQDVEKKYNIKGKNLTIDPEAFTIYEETESTPLSKIFNFPPNKSDDSLIN